MEGQIITNCQNKSVNSGVESCVKVEGRTTALLIADARAKFPSDPKVFNDNLSKYISSQGANRIIPIKNIIANTPSGGEIATSEVGFAGARPVGLSGYSETYQIDAGDCLYKELSKLNKRSVQVWRIDSDRFLYGSISNAKDVNNFDGFLGIAYAHRTKGTDMTTLGSINLTIYYSPNYESQLQKLNAFEVNAVPDGLLGVTLKRVAAGVAKVVGQCGGTDFTETYGSDWTATMFVNEAGVKPTSVTYNAAKGELTFVPVAAYRVAGASVLEVGDITGLDGLNSFVSLT